MNTYKTFGRFFMSRDIHKKYLDTEVINKYYDLYRYLSIVPIELQSQIGHGKIIISPANNEPIFIFHHPKK